MSLQTDIESAMRAAMKARDAVRVSTLRLAMAAAHNRQIELGHELTDAEVVEVLDRQVKQRRESIELYRKGGRPELADAEEAELAVLREFLPEPLTDAELERLARDAVAATDAKGPTDMGRVMGALVPQTRGRADGKAVSELVRRLLSEGSAE
ncbi:MAG TPA: GatB/YqeY domain-containing protein [Pleomorphomonadaceae bacterium]|nr:GatB/YqeY domain-containing protein [Pleomorphomonadaceae bacterium]